MINFDNWLNSLKINWINKDIDSIIELFDNSTKYFETPFEEINGIENIRIAWHDIDKHDIKDLKYKILGIKDNTVIANYILLLTSGKEVDMVYEITLSSTNKCIYFKQWFMHNN